MCTQSAARRRRAQAKNAYGHIDPMRRPRYSKSALVNIHAAIERERARAAREAAAKRKKK